MIRVSGSNFKGFVSYHRNIDLLRFYTYHHLELLTTHGIEACRCVFLNELLILVAEACENQNFSYCLLLADRLTYNGILESTGKSGFDSFAITTCAIFSSDIYEDEIIASTLHSNKDPLVSVSDAILIGQLALFGTTIPQLKILY